MSTSNMNFGPEWMRRLSRANSNQSLESLGQLSAQAGLTSADQPYSSDGGSFPSPFTNGNSAGANQAFTTSYSSITGKPKGESSQQRSEIEVTPSDSLNPFHYSKELMLSLYRPTEAPLDFERHEYVCSEETLPPMAHYPLTEAESALLATGQINSIARRNPSTPYPTSGSSRGDRNREPNSGRGRTPRPQSNKSTASNPWPGATKNSIGTFGADGMFRLDGVSDMVLEPRDYDPRTELFETEIQLTYPSTGSQDDIGGLVYGTSSNQALFNDESIPIDPSGRAPLAGRGSLKNILAGIAGFDIDIPDPVIAPSKVSKWFYKDPSNATQGPFTGYDMHEWFKMGYFTGDLLVRREEESTYETLDTLISRVENDDNPFLTPPRAAHLRTILTPAVRVASSIKVTSLVKCMWNNHA
ncbi:kinesin-like protein [Entomophthora muscae]|uniref:Kinesin-like protein n=1 Tax=Entomophthora muscae TaxID=34485 RepID=A0ACC2TMA1_9FUNG|nr:kinesin-like protein [Entomophthora muscae]